MLLRAFVQQKRLGCGGLLVLPPIEKEHALDRRSVGADDGLNVIESPANRATEMLRMAAFFSQVIGSSPPRSQM